MKNDMNKTVFVLLLILGLITIYQYFVGEWSATEPGWLWNLVDTVVVVLYAYLAGSKLRLS
ncbi:MAG: hypothetical protein OXU73_02010 [Candidatus Campbellbacteria bacterium]|nr:hypothetical protein [Candidatus Campbellbacteria bacterium]